MRAHSWIGQTDRAGLARLYKHHGDKVRFLMAGVFNTGFSYALFALLLMLLDGPLQSLSTSANSVASLMGHYYYTVIQWINWVLCVPPNTLAMKYFAFRSKGDWKRQVGRAYFVYLPTQVLSFCILLVTVRVLHLAPLLGQLVAIVGALMASYIGHKHFTFREPRQEPPADDANGAA
jgi:putative flippase GtrA